MLDELTSLLKGTRLEASIERIKQTIVEENILGKPTASSRKMAFGHLRRAYALDMDKALWRVLRRFYEQEPQALNLMGLVLVYSRDLQLRKSFELVTGMNVGEALPPTQMVEHLEAAFPGMYSAVVMKATAKNVNSTWVKTGHLTGRVHKVRSHPKPHWLATTYAMFTGYLAGVRGQMLLDSVYARLVGVDPMTAAEHLSIASAHGLLRFRNAGGVVETDFSALLQPAEQLMLHGAY